MDSVQKLKEVKVKFMPVYSQFANHYRGLFSPSADSEKVKHCKYWLDELTQSSINPDDIPTIAEKIKESAEFKRNPPNPSQFILFAKKISQCSSSSLSEDSFDSEFYQIFNRMRERYRALWDKHAENEYSPTYKFWLEEIKALEIDISIIKNAFMLIPKVPNYLTYPPSINEVALLLRIMSCPESIPLVHQAEEIAVSRDVNVHPIIRYCRYRLNIRQIDKKDLSRKFGEFYANAVTRYLDGSLNLDGFKEKVTQNTDCLLYTSPSPRD